MGVDLPFESGLNIIRAGNSNGKSTCFQCIVYGLGLDQLLTNRQQHLPLAPALVSKIYDVTTESDLPVTESLIHLQIFNPETGHRATIKRYLSGPTDTRLLRVFNNRAIEGIGNCVPLELFARAPGAATSEHGFERWFAEDFLRWSLPNVEKNDGSIVHLYLATIFPLFFVEQRTGWSRIQGNMPYVFGIRDVAKRATEYILTLSNSSDEAARAKALQDRRDVQSRYRAVVDTMVGLAAHDGASIRGIPDRLGDEMPTISITVSVNGAWQIIDERLSAIRARLEALGTEIGSSKRKASPQIVQLRQQKATQLERLDETLGRERIETQELAGLSQRRRTLEEDLDKLRDLKTLRAVGGAVGTSITPTHCPTCWQPITDAVVPGATSVLSLEDTIALMQGEIALVKRSAIDSKLRRDSLRAERESCERDLASTEAALDLILHIPETDLNVDAIRETLALKQELGSLERLRQQLASALTELKRCIDEGIALNDLLKLLPNGLSQRDRQKLNDLQEVFQEQERQYGFKSYSDISDIKISSETYKPSVDGFDLSYETSASDAIRTIWSYLVGLLECRRAFTDMHHTRLLIFDEPRQQSADKVSFGQLLRRVANTSNFNEQVIFFTSEETSLLRDALQGCSFTLCDFQEQMLVRVKN